MGQTASRIGPQCFSCKDHDLLCAARTGDSECLQLALAEQPLLLVLANHKGTGLLHTAAQEGDVDVLKLLISLIKTHAAALAAAVRCNCKKQQQPGAQQQQQQHPDSKQQQDKVLKSRWKQMLSLQPSWPRSKRQLKRLMQPNQVLHTLINWQNDHGLTPLMLACQQGHTAAAALLLEEGAEPLLFDRGTRRSCLHYAAIAGHTGCVNLLVKEWRQVLVLRRGREQRVLLQDVQLRDGVTGTNRYIDVRTNSGFSALHFAAYWGHTGTVKALLSAGASVLLQTANGICGGVELLVSRGSNALHLAAANGHTETAAAMLQAHVETLAEVVPRPPSFTHSTAAHILTGNQQQQQQQQEQQQQQQQQQLRLPWEGCQRLDPRSALNSCGRTPAAVAAVLRQPDVLQMLLKPDVPITLALQQAGLGSTWLGVPTLAVLAKAVLDQHLSESLSRLEAQLQQAQQQTQHEQTTSNNQWLSTMSACLDISKPDPEMTTEVAAITVHCETTPSGSCNSLLGLTGRTLGNSSSSSSSSGACGVTAFDHSLQCLASNSSSAKYLDITGQNHSNAAREPSEVSESTCGICFEATSSVMLTSCKHCLCAVCARSVVTATTSSKPAVCPFCRQGVGGFKAIECP